MIANSYKIRTSCGYRFFCGFMAVGWLVSTKEGQAKFKELSGGTSLEEIREMLEKLNPADFTEKEYFKGWPPSPRANGSTGGSSPLESSRDDLGGIDLTPNNLDLQTKGRGMDASVPVNAQDLLNMPFDGFTPVIIQIVPTNLPLLLGIAGQEEQKDDLSFRLPLDSALPVNRLRAIFPETVADTRRRG